MFKLYVIFVYNEFILVLYWIIFIRAAESKTHADLKMLNVPDYCTV